MGGQVAPRVARGSDRADLKRPSASVVRYPKRRACLRSPRRRRCGLPVRSTVPGRLINIVRASRRVDHRRRGPAVRRRTASGARRESRWSRATIGFSGGSESSGKRGHSWNGRNDGSVRIEGDRTSAPQSRAGLVDHCSAASVSSPGGPRTGTSPPGERIVLIRSTPGMGQDRETTREPERLRSRNSWVFLA